MIYRVEVNTYLHKLMSIYNKKKRLITIKIEVKKR
jgi:hypothetical protein